MTRSSATFGAFAVRRHGPERGAVARTGRSHHRGRFRLRIGRARADLVSEVDQFLELDPVPRTHVSDVHEVGRTRDRQCTATVASPARNKRKCELNGTNRAQLVLMQTK